MEDFFNSMAFFILKIWRDFYNIYNLVKINKLNSKQIQDQTKSWANLFLSVFQRSEITPYIHVFISHLSQFVDMHNDINKFNIQGLEKLNDLTTSQYFRGTNKKKDYLKQILAKRNRIEYLTGLFFIIFLIYSM